MTKDDVIKKLKSMPGSKKYSDEGDKYMYVYEVGPVRFKYDGSPVYFDTMNQAYAAWDALTDEEKGFLKTIGNEPVAPFDWSTARPGMAFLCRFTGGILHYVGPHLYDTNQVVTVERFTNSSMVVFKDNLTRYPSYDIGVLQCHRA